MTKNKAMSRFMLLSSLDSQRVVAIRAGTTRGHMKHLAAGSRVASSALAIRLERAAAKHASVPLHREQLSPACGGCEFAKLCRSKGK